MAGKIIELKGGSPWNAWLHTGEDPPYGALGNPKYLLLLCLSDLGILNCLVVMGYPQSLGSNQLMKWDVPLSA